MQWEVKLSSAKHGGHKRFEERAGGGPPAVPMRLWSSDKAQRQQLQMPPEGSTEAKTLLVEVQVLQFQALPPSSTRQESCRYALPSLLAPVLLWAIKGIQRKSRPSSQ